MLSNGTTAIATSGDASVPGLVATSGYYSRIVIVNTGAAAGFFSIDGGVTWGYLPAAGSRTLINPLGIGVNVVLKRIASGTDLSGVYIDAE